jgi:hypothetical protein
LQKCDPEGEVVMDYNKDDVLPTVEGVSESWDDSEESRYHLRKFNKKYMICYLESESRCD